MQLIELQQRCDADILAPGHFRCAPGVLTADPFADPREATAAERLAVHTVVAEGVKWFAEMKPDRLSRRAYERFNAQVAERAERSIELVCGFGIVIGALLSWLIGQALTWLWNWWRETRDAPQLVFGMVAA